MDTSMRISTGHCNPRYFWCRQLHCALEALELLHESGLVVGCFEAETIYCIRDSPDAVLFPFNLAAAGERAYRLHRAKFYPRALRIYSKEDDVIAAALTYCELRLSDHGAGELIELQQTQAEPASQVNERREQLSHVIKIMEEK